MTRRAPSGQGLDEQCSFMHFGVEDQHRRHAFSEMMVVRVHSLARLGCLLFLLWHFNDLPM